VKAVNLNTKSHYCRPCGRVYPGPIIARELLCCDHEAGEELNNVCSYTAYGCADPRGACTLSENEFESFDQCWQCGECERHHGTLPEAMACCS
jgi:hypothetical protein